MKTVAVTILDTPTTTTTKMCNEMRAENLK